MKSSSSSDVSSVNGLEDTPRKSATRPKKGRKTRAEKTEESRRRLMNAAASLIGEEGYARATIAKITARAELSLGSFYNYFENREDLFQQLLPQMGEDLQSYIAKRVTGITDPLREEEVGLNAFLDFVIENEGFYRILNEAETVVPDAYRRHFDNISSGYVRALRRHKAAGHLLGYDSSEFDCLVYMLMAARNYLVMRYGPEGLGRPELRRQITRTYMKFVSGGLLYEPDGNGRSHCA